MLNFETWDGNRYDKTYWKKWKRSKWQFWHFLEELKGLRFRLGLGAQRGVTSWWHCSGLYDSLCLHAWQLLKVHQLGSSAKTTPIVPLKCGILSSFSKAHQNLCIWLNKIFTNLKQCDVGGLPQLSIIEQSFILFSWQVIMIQSHLNASVVFHVLFRSSLCLPKRRHIFVCLKCRVPSGSCLRTWGGQGGRGGRGGGADLVHFCLTQHNSPQLIRLSPSVRRSIGRFNKATEMVPFALRSDVAAASPAASQTVIAATVAIVSYLLIIFCILLYLVVLVLHCVWLFFRCFSCLLRIDWSPGRAALKQFYGIHFWDLPNLMIRLTQF